ncbi:hypothetical protein ACWEU6_22595 [Streptosporangium sandarakinum]
MVPPEAATRVVRRRLHRAIRRAVDDAAAHGVYTVIDMHQDA